MDVYYEPIELLLQANDLLVYPTGNLVLLGLIENEFLNIGIDLLDAEDDLLGVGLDLSDLIEDALYLSFLHLHVHNDLVDALQVLVAIQVTRHLGVLCLHVLKGLLLMFKLLNGFLDLLLESLDLLSFELILYPLLIDLLFLTGDLVTYRLLVLLPLVAQVL